MIELTDNKWIFLMNLILLTSCSIIDRRKINSMQNSLNCDTAQKVCVINSSDPQELSVINNEVNAKIKLIYFTDPICSSCWGIEPQLRKLKLEYGQQIEWNYHMGGLLPDWSYNSGGISKPSDVAVHWDEVSPHYDMPIDGDVWLEDPLHSSYPPSIAFKAAQIQDPIKALQFLRRIREMVFIEKRNITKWEHLDVAAKECGLDLKKMHSDYESEAEQLFKNDLTLAKQYGVRGFPTLFIVNSNNQTELVYGARPYSTIIQAIQRLDSSLHRKINDKQGEELFRYLGSLTLREYSELTELSKAESQNQINQLMKENKLIEYKTKNGSLWKLTH